VLPSCWSVRVTLSNVEVRKHHNKTGEGSHRILKQKALFLTTGLCYGRLFTTGKDVCRTEHGFTVHTHLRHTFIHSFTGAYSPELTFGLRFRCFLITHIQTHGTTPLDEWSARRRGLYLHRTTKHINTTDKHPCPERVSNPRSQQAAADRAVTGPGDIHYSIYYRLWIMNFPPTPLTRDEVLNDVFPRNPRNYCTYKTRSWGSSVRTAVDYRLDDRGSSPGTGKRLFL
jgi:hypothetical protein